MTTLLTIAKLNGSDAIAGLLDEAARAVPELSGINPNTGAAVPGLGFSRTIKGVHYKTKVRTSLPVSGFRKANAGVASSASTYENRLVEASILNPRWECDVAVADAHEDGAEAFITDEAEAMTQSALMTAGRQLYYGTGTGGDSSGHPGLINAVQSSMEINAAGTTANTGSSVWAIVWGPKHTSWVIGKDGKFEMEDVRKESKSDPDTAANKFTVYAQELLAWLGLQVNSIYSVGRIRRLTADSGKGLTDARLGALLALFPTGFRPGCFMASRRSIEQLRASRTATNATGAEAPTPTSYEGVPIVPTDSILDTESVA